MSFRHLTALFALLTVALLSGCGEREGKVVRRGGQQQDVSMVSAENAKMNAAFVEAQKAIPQFIAALQHPKPSQRSFLVKVKVSDGTSNEYMWLQNLTYDGTRFQGRLMDDPYEVKGYRQGQIITVLASETFDWMYSDSGERVGGYTERVLEEMGAK